MILVVRCNLFYENYKFILNNHDIYIYKNPTINAVHLHRFQNVP
jgi:hypothetical protein